MSCWSKDIFLQEKLNKNFLCPFGKGVMNKPMMDGCGHQYCEKCLKNLLDSNMNCKVSEKPILKPQKFVENLLASKLISNLKIKCLNFESGCEWKGVLKELNNHLLEDCIYQEVQCTKSNCKQLIQRKDLQKHQQQCEYRIINCPECNVEIIFNQKQQHEEECPKKDIQCPEKCGQIIKRKNIQNHLKNFCRNLSINCPYHTCTIRGDRKSVQEHVFSKNGFILHQNLLSEQVMKIQNKLSSVDSFVDNLRFQLKEREQKNQKQLQSKEKFDPFYQSQEIFINNTYDKAIKLRNTPNTIVLINSCMDLDKQFFFRVNCQSVIGLGICDRQEASQNEYFVADKNNFKNIFMFKLTSPIVREDIYLELFMQLDNNQNNVLVLKNLNNQSITRLFIPQSAKRELSPIVILNNKGDSAEILNQNNQENQEYDFFNDDKKLEFSDQSSINQIYLSRAKLNLN